MAGDSRMKVAVIGTGPAALGATKALLERGVDITVFDRGAVLSPDREEIAARLSQTKPDEWSAGDRAGVSTAPVGKTSTIPRKHRFGSHYVYGDTGTDGTEVNSPGPVASRAFGGYSTVWGGSVLPLPASEAEQWAKGSAPAESDYREVLKGVRIVGSPSEHDRHMPLPGAPLRAIPLNPQASALISDIDRAARKLATRGIVAGQSRLMIDHRRCTACALCLSGCVYNAIYSTEEEFDLLRKNKRIGYRGGVFVERLDEQAGRVKVTFRDLSSGEMSRNTFDRVFVAAGAIGSTALMLSSLRMYDHTVDIADSQKFLVPFLRFRRSRAATDAPGITLASAFIDIAPDSLSPHWTHLQLTPINPMVLEHLGIGPDPARGRTKKALLAPLLDRLMVGWGGLHSDLSGHLSIRMSAPTQPDRSGALKLEAHRSRAATKAAKAAIAEYRRIGLAIGGLVPPLGVQIAEPGAGNHFGASMPMKATPKTASETDILGRLGGYSRVHIVDSSVFPAIAATTIMLPSMANAYRIAREAPLDD